MKKLFSFWIEKKDYQDLRNLSKKTERSIAYLIRKAIKNLLKMKKK